MHVVLGCVAVVFAIGDFLLGMKYGRVLEAKAQAEARQLKLDLQRDIKKI